MTAAFTLRALIARWRRLVASAVTVAFGVAMVTGALVFTDTTHAAYQRLFNGADSGAQLIVSARQTSGTGAASGSQATQTPAAPDVPIALLAKVRALSGVSAAAGQITAPATIVGADGHPLSSTPQTVAMSSLAAPFTGVDYRSGGPPTTAGDVVIDAATAAQQHWQVGDTVAISTSQPAERFLVTGIATLGSSGGERFAIFTLSETRRLYQANDYSQIVVAARPGTALSTLSAAIRRLLPAGLEVQSQATQVQAAVSRISTAFSTLNGGLDAFAVVAVLIGALVVFNTFATTATQRQRELALLRALGATRRQVLAASLIEALAIGALGAVIGVIGGPFVALVVRSLFSGVGTGVGAGQLTVGAGSVAIGFVVGLVVSLVAALVPALRASRAAPVEALRTSYGALATRRPRAWTLLALGVSAGCEAGGLVLTLTASGDQAHRLVLCAIGGALMLLGALIAGPLVVALFAWIGGLRGSDPIFELAREQAMVNRGRTALSASSLMIGIGLALVISVYVSGLRSATSAAIHQTVVGDVVIESQDAAQPIPAASVRAAAAVPDLAAISTLKTVTARLAGAGAIQVSGIDPTSWSQVYHFDWAPGSGSHATLASLNSGEVLVEADTARAAGARVGSRLSVLGPSGQRLSLRVAGIYRDSGLLKGVTMALGYFNREFNQPQLQDVFVKLTGTVSESVALTALRRALVAFPGVVVRNQRQLAERLAANVSDVVDLLYALLVLAVLMSLLGIGGSLSLGVQTRTGELGTLRALGMTPAQARALVRNESVLTALAGGICGAVLGLVLALCISHALAAEGFAFRFPWLALVGSGVAVGLSGLLASVLPGRRASRMPMLAAISYE